MKEHIFPQNDIYYRTNNFEATRQTIVFIHGLSGNSSAWEPYEKEFMNEYNLLCVDLRGHGCSRKYSKEKDYAIEFFVNDVEALLAHLQIKEYIIASHSFGSLISIGLIQSNPDKVKSAIFLAPAFKPKNSLSTKIVRLISGTIAFCLCVLPALTKPGKRIDYSRLIPTSDWNIHRIFIDIRNTGLAIYFFCLHSLYASFNDEFISQICMPVVIIHGRRDSIVPIKHSVWASDKIAGSKLVTLPLADHMLIFNYPGEISRIMAEFLAKIY